MKMEPGKINSLLKRKDSIESTAIEHQQTQEKDLKERTEKIMGKVLEDYESLKKMSNVIREKEKAVELLKSYGTSDNIPETELDIENSGCDDARLLAMCKIMESEEKEQEEQETTKATETIH